MTPYEEITFLGRANPNITLKQHIFEMRETNKFPKARIDAWYRRGLRSYTKVSYVTTYYKDTDYWKDDMSNDELLSQILVDGSHSRLLKIAGRRIAELLDELEGL